MRSIRHVVACVFLVISAPSFAKGINMEPGMWQWTMVAEVPGMSMTLPPNVYKDCITKEEMVPQQPDQDDQCKMIESNIKSNKVTWKIECKGKDGDATSEGIMHYQGDKAQGNITILTQGMVMKATLDGKRIGACES